MTGEEHYLEAEQLVRMAGVDRDQLYAETGLEPAEALAAAQVHATLAVAYAHLPVTMTVETKPMPGMPFEKVVGVTRTERRSS